jgi:hypothetical protein
MKTESDEHETLDQAFRIAFLLTGSTEIAESAVLDGIASLKVSHVPSEALVFESAKSAIRRRALYPPQRSAAFVDLPVELRRLFLLAPIYRDCFVFRILLGVPSATCAAVLHVPGHKINAFLGAGFRDLSYLNAFGWIWPERLCYIRRCHG